MRFWTTLLLWLPCFVLPTSLFLVAEIAPGVIVSTCYSLLCFAGPGRVAPLHTEDAVAELAAVKTPSCLTSAPRFRCVWTDPYSGACKINARPVLRGHRLLVRCRGFLFRRSKFPAPPPPLYKVEGRCAGHSKQIWAFILQERIHSFPFNIVPRGAGGGGGNLNCAKQVSWRPDHGPRVLKTGRAFILQAPDPRGSRNKICDVGPPLLACFLSCRLVPFLPGSFCSRRPRGHAKNMRSAVSCQAQAAWPATQRTPHHAQKRTLVPHHAGLLPLAA